MEAALILGIDPGSRVTGFGLVRSQGRQLSAVESGTIRLESEPEMSLRLALLQRKIDEILDRHRPGAVAVEDVFASRNARSALLLGQARGAALAAAGSRGLPVHAYPPALIKKAVGGHGRADKGQIQRMVRVLLGMDRLPAPDEADALAAAVCHALCCRGGAPAVGRGGRTGAGA